MNGSFYKVYTFISEKKLDLFVILSFLIIFSSINTKPIHFFSLDFTPISIFNFLRFSLPFLLIFPLIYLNLKIKKISNIVFLYIIFFLLQFLGAILNFNLIGSNFNNFYLIIDAISILLLFNLINFKKNNAYKKLFKILFAILFFSLIIYISEYLENYYTDTYFFLYDFKDFYTSQFLETTLAHSSGVSRVVLLFLVFVMSYMIIYKKFNITLFFLCILITSFLWGYQSRGTIILLFIFYFFLFLLAITKKIKLNIFIIPLIFFLSLIFWEAIYVSKIKLNFNQDLKDGKILTPSIIDSEKPGVSKFNILNEENFLLNLTTLKYNRFVTTIERYLKITLVYKNERKEFLKKLDTGKNISNLKEDNSNNEIYKPYYNVNDAPLTSGRTVIWKRIVNTFEFNKIFGYGYQADRFLLRKINKENTTYGSNSSNGYLYSLICGGYFALIIFIVLNFLALREVLNFTKKLSVLSNNEVKLYGLISSSLLILIFFRSIIENAHSYFGIDLIVFIFCNLYLQKINKELILK